MDDPITDIWFRTALPLAEIAERLGLGEVTQDAEDYWAWVIGTLMGEWLDITRTHTRSPADTDTRIFRVDGGPFTTGMLAEIVVRVREFVSSSVVAGRWEYLVGNEFNLVVVRNFESAG
jgi:hypothetical protein